MRFRIYNPYVRDIIALIVLLGTACVLALWAYQPFQTATFTMGTPPALLSYQGLYETEQFPDSSGIYRWTDGYGQLQLPNPGGTPLLKLKLAGGVRNIVPVHIHTVNSTFTFLVGPEIRTYKLSLPAVHNEQIALTIESSMIPENGRDLGVVVSDITITGGGTIPGHVLLALLGATISGYLLLRQVGLSSVVTVGALVITQGLVLLWQHAGGWHYSQLGSVLLLTSGASLAAVVIERLWSPTLHPPNPMAVLSRREVYVVAILLLAALSIRLPWMGATDPVGDLELAARRMEYLYENGLAGAYLYGGDYVPLRLYILWGLSHFVHPLGGVFFEPLPTPTLVLIKIPSLLADLTTVVLIYIWSRRWCAVRRAAAITALYTLAPPVWINMAWWGQVDTLLMLPLLGTVMLLDRGSGRWSWLCWAVALMIKPQAIVLAPLLFVATLRRHGCRGIVQGGLVALGVIVVACTPLVLANQGPGLLEAYLGSVGRFPRLTNGAYNLWYLVSRDGDGHDSSLIWGLLSYRTTGMLLVGGAALVVCYGLLRQSSGPIRAEGAAVLALAFFVLPTQIHQRYLFLTLAFLILRIPSDERIVFPYIVLVATATINILGTLDGFIPLAEALIAATPLSLVCAIINMIVLGGLTVHFLTTSSQVDQTLVTATPTQQQSTSHC